MFNYKFKDIIVDNDFTVALDYEGNIYGTGLNINGQFGTGTYESSGSTVFKEIIGQDIKKVFTASNAECTFFLKNDGTLWGCGLNNYGQLGLGNTATQLVPAQIDFTDVKEIFCGSDHTMALKNDGTLWGTGYNSSGNLGLNHGTSMLSFTQITSMTNVKKVSCGWSHTAVLKNDGTVWATGDNSYGQLGSGNTTTIAYYKQMTSITNAKDIYCGGNHTIILKNDGTLWGCGYNGFGQLGLGTTNSSTTCVQIASNVESMAGGANFTVIKKTDGTIWVCGTNSYGNLGFDTAGANVNTFTQLNVTNVKEIHCGWYHIMVLKNDGTLWTSGLNNGGAGDVQGDIKVLTQVDFTDVKEIQCGWTHTFITKTDGTVWATGDNTNGQLIYRTFPKYMSFTKLGIDNVREIQTNDYKNLFILKNDDTLWVSGANNYGQLGLGESKVVTEFTKAAEDVKEVYQNGMSTFLLKNDGTVWFAGYSYYGSSGLGTETPNYYTRDFTKVNITNVKKICLGEVTTVFLKNDGTVWGCGNSTYGTLGTGSTSVAYKITQATITDVRDISAGTYHVFAIKNDGSLWGAGFNYYGQLGVGSSGNMTSSYYNIKINNVKKLVCDLYNSFMIKEDNTLWVCGVNSSNSLGLNSTAQTVNSFTQLPVSNIKDVKVTSLDHYIVLCNDGTLWCNGYNDYGELGLGEDVYQTALTQIDIDNINVDRVISGMNTTFLITKDGEGYFSGNNCYGNTGCHVTQSVKHLSFSEFTPYETVSNVFNTDYAINGELVTVTKGSNSGEHEMLTDDEFIYVRGNNEYGQLGLGDNTDRDDYIKIEMTGVTGVSCGEKHSAIVNKQGEVFVCGCNNEGQLGLGNYDDTNVFVKISIEDVKFVKSVRGITVIELNNGMIYFAGGKVSNVFKKYK